MTGNSHISHSYRRIFILFLFLGIVFSLRSQQRWFSVDVRQPAAVVLPREIQEAGSLMLVNNSVCQPDDFGHQNKVEDKSADNSRVDLSDAARQLLFGAEETLFGQEVFDEVSLLVESQNTSGSFFRQTPFTSARADSLCALYDVDALLVLNQLVLYDGNEQYVTVNDTYANLLTGYCTAQWALFFRGKAQPFRFSVSDTLYWQAEEMTPAALAAAIPDRQEALLYLAHDNGVRTARSIVPQWVSEERYLYLTREGELDAGLEAFTRQDWQRALDLWQQAYRLAADSNRKKTRSAITAAYAAADMAVAAEMLGKKQDAERYIDAAVQNFASVNTVDARQQIINLRYYKSRLK